MNNGKDRIRSTKSKGISGMVLAARGDGRIGLAGLVSTLNDRINDEADSGNCWPLAWYCA